MKYFLLLSSAIILLPSLVLAQNPRSIPTRLENPLSVGSIQDLLVAILNIVMILMIPVIVFFIIYAGFLYVTARGNAEQIKQATRALTYAIIGAILVVGAFAIAEIVRATVSSFSATPSNPAPTAPAPTAPAPTTPAAREAARLAEFCRMNPGATDCR